MGVAGPACPTPSSLSPSPFLTCGWEAGARRVSPPVGPAEEALGVGGGPWVWAGGTTLPDRPW